MSDVGHINKVLCKAKHYGFADSLLTFSEILEQSDKHVLFPLMIVCFICLKGKSHQK